MAAGIFKKFYNSASWKVCRQNILNQRGNICEDCGRLITNPKEIHCHHTVELNNNNITDPTISLNPELIKVYCKDCHDKAHKRFKYKETKHSKDVVIVCGAPCSGKTTYVLKHKDTNDLVVDLDKIYEAITLLPCYCKPATLKSNAFAVRNILLDNIRTRAGEFNRAWVIGGYANIHDRERIARELGAEIVMMGTSEGECLARLEGVTDYRRHLKAEWKQYIKKYFEDYII